MALPTPKVFLIPFILPCVVIGIVSLAAWCTFSHCAPSQWYCGTHNCIYQVAAYTCILGHSILSALFSFSCGAYKYTHRDLHSQSTLTTYSLWYPSPEGHCTVRAHVSQGQDLLIMVLTRGLSSCLGAYVHLSVPWKSHLILGFAGSRHTSLQCRLLDFSLWMYDHNWGLNS